MIQDSLTQFLTNLVASSPYLIVLALGFAWSLVIMRQHPTPAMLVALGTALLLVNSVAMTALQIWVIPKLTGGNGPDNVRLVFQLLGIVRSILSAVGIGLLLVGCFSGRSPTR